MKFHPDLAASETDRKLCEVIMKKINRAYAERDLQALTEIYLHNYNREGTAEDSFEALMKMYVRLENSVISMECRFRELKKSEWYTWKRKIQTAKKSGVDIFREMEDSLYDDIVRKMRILSELKKEITIAESLQAH